MDGYNHIFVTTILYIIYIYTIHLLYPYYNGLTILYFIISIYTIPMDPSTFLGSVWNIIYYNLEA